jgi:PPP family 3-phenylpropionic acid transporter
MVPRMANNPRPFGSLILASQYFLYFGVMGIFLPYFNLYCFHIGFNGFQIGLISALRSVLLIIFPLVWGLLADRYQARRSIYILCNLLSAAIWSLLLLTTQFWPMFIITVCYGIFYAPLISFLEAFAMEVLGTEKRRYGQMRMWGSLAFILMVLMLGRGLDLYSIEVVPAMILAASLVQALFSFGIPESSQERKKPIWAGARLLFNKRVLLFLFCAFLMLVSHAAYYAFFSIHLENLGFGKTFIGLCWAVATTAEILVMIKSDHIFRRFSFENVLIFSFVVSVLRWLLLARLETGAFILLSQILHAVTYGSFHMASILYIDHLSPPQIKTTGQAVNNAVTYGLGLTVGFFISGTLYEALGAPVLFALSALIALLGGGLMVLFDPKPQSAK